MHNKTKGALAGVAGLALLAGGTTFAIWSDSDTVDGGVLTSGNLDIAAAAQVEYWDITPNRADATGTTPRTGVPGHAIDDITKWRMVPGDVVEVTLGYALALEGDNLQAALVVGGEAAATGELLAGSSYDSDNPQGVSFTYDVLDADGTILAEDVAYGEPTRELRFQAANTGQESGTEDPGVTVVDRTALTGGELADLYVVVTATFDETTPARVRTQVTAELHNIGATFTQVHDGAGFEGP